MPLPGPETLMDIPKAMPAQQLDQISSFDDVDLSGLNESPLLHQESSGQTTLVSAALDRVVSGSQESCTEGGRKSISLTSSVLKTSVSRCNDVLDILFAAAQVEPETSTSQPSGSGHDNSDSCWAPSTQTNQDVMLNNGLSVQSIRIISSAPKQMRSVWRKCRFVRTGLLSVEEAVALVDSFFIDMLPHAPTLDGFYADHANHHQLVVYEPFLCCVILTLSSRYHFFPTAGGRARSDLIHHALWEACQQLLMQPMLGQERSSISRIRTPGSIEALLLLIEWHPQALHLPDFDDLDSDTSTTSSNPAHESEPATETRTVAKWLATIISSSRQSHRMAGMLLGCAVALANELGMKKSKLDYSLSTLAQAISGLETNRPDDLHFGYQYVKLLDVCMANLQASFLPSMGLQSEQEELSDCQSELMAGASTLDFASIGDMDSCFNLSWFDVLTNPFLDSLERTETCGYDSLDHDLFSL
ncbi:hypothetical protein H9Q74_007889 [Fusarium xylarioides]|nr:hypothetical protein H9Q71_008227 [Fusarium xylarioides]KAG5822006.1 hypothetical protein H9Q74_007889 [Fusarium xylarioides]